VIRSMTGYGSASLDSESLRASASVRSLNHRFLELSLQCARVVRPLEPEIRAAVQARLERGRVDLTLHASFLDEGGEVVVASRPLVAGVVRALRELQAHHGLEGGVQVSDILRFPGALEVETASELEAERRAELLGVVERALDGLEAMRRGEGEALAAELSLRLDAIGAAADRLEARAAENREARVASLLERARGLVAELGLEEPRLYQEVVRLVDRGEIAEELQRLRSHVAQARALVAGDGACGKRLDFLAQELMREANTVGSKAASAPVVQEVVALKSEIEKLREQVQNVE